MEHSKGRARLCHHGELTAMPVSASSSAQTIALFGECEKLGFGCAWMFEMPQQPGSKPTCIKMGAVTVFVQTFNF